MPGTGRMCCGWPWRLGPTAGVARRCHDPVAFCRRDGSGASGLLQVTRDRALTLLFFFLPLCALSFRFCPKPFVFLPFSPAPVLPVPPHPRSRSRRSAAGAFVALPGRGTFAVGCPQGARRVLGPAVPRRVAAPLERHEVPDSWAAAGHGAAGSGAAWQGQGRGSGWEKGGKKVPSGVAGSSWELRSPRRCSRHLPVRLVSPRSSVPSRWRRGNGGSSLCLGGEGWRRSRRAPAHPGHLPALAPAALSGRCTEPVRGAAEECRQLDTRWCR